ncbi:GYDIA family GHMP kinase [Corallibacter vietnamensis]|uniref:GYDIA family GHMP kinase n=1 Tax=Corallibacter vietnamensis TaxID=904130 RepID=A0ABP7GUA9_9FLAO
MNTFSHGKLLITGEYVVLDGALALSIPTKFGQSLSAKSNNESRLNWENFDENSNIWYDTSIDINTLKTINKGDLDNPITQKLIQILKATKNLNPDFLTTGFDVKNKLTFPRNWGLGTSSTLINNIANWAKVDAYELLELTFGGSGYDIACAQNSTAITYKLLKNQDTKRHVKQINFNPAYKDCLYFVYLNKKQNSREGIAHYKANAVNIPNAVLAISKLTSEIINSNTLSDFESLISQHETIISKVTQQVPIKEKLFSDFNGQIKSLGAWGGDFILVTSKKNPASYFSSKGFNTIIPYQDMLM